MVKVRQAPALRLLNSVLELLHCSLRQGYRSARTSTGLPAMTFRLVFGRCGSLLSMCHSMWLPVCPYKYEHARIEDLSDLVLYWVGLLRVDLLTLVFLF